MVGAAGACSGRVLVVLRLIKVELVRRCALSGHPRLPSAPLVASSTQGKRGGGVASTYDFDLGGLDRRRCRRSSTAAATATTTTAPPAAVRWRPAHHHLLRRVSHVARKRAPAPTPPAAATARLAPRPACACAAQLGCVSLSAGTGRWVCDAAVEGTLFACWCWARYGHVGGAVETLSLSRC